MIFNDSFVNIVTITFSALIIIELLNVFSEINKLNMKMIIILVSTAIIYFLSIILFKNYLNISYMSPSFGLKILMICALAWLPIFIVEKIIEKCDP